MHDDDRPDGGDGPPPDDADGAAPAHAEAVKGDAAAPPAEPTPDARGPDLADQYADQSNLAARGRFNEQFSTLERHPHRWVFERVDLPPDARVLSVGCGTGSLWTVNADRVPPGWRVVLTDFSPGMVRDACANLEDAGFDVVPTFDYAVADADAVPVAAGSVDAVVANQMLYHVPDLDGTLADLRRALGNGGVLYATTKTRRAKRRLYDLMDEVLDADVTAPNADSQFAVENGRGALEAHFETVGLHTLDSSCVVDDPDALVAYAATCRQFDGVPDFDADAADRLRERFAAEMADGPLVLQGLFGLFEGRPG